MSKQSFLDVFGFVPKPSLPVNWRNPVSWFPFRISSIYWSLPSSSAVQIGFEQVRNGGIDLATFAKANAVLKQQHESNEWNKRLIIMNGIQNLNLKEQKNV